MPDSFPDDALPCPDGYRELAETVAWADVSPRESVVVAGADAVRFVDGFCTAAVGRIAPGAGGEAFFLDSRGQVLLWGTVLRAGDGVWIDAGVPPAGPEGEARCLAAHLDRYHIRERLQVVDRAAESAWLLVAGPSAAACLRAAGATLPAAAPIGHTVDRMEAFAAGDFPGTCAGVPAAIVRGSWAGAGSFLVVVPAAERARVVDRLRDDGVPVATPAALESARLEAGRPGPADFPPRTLPQEVGRDREAIAFDKGCYLGQETVARLDSLGHVNRRLVVVLSRRTRLAPGMRVEAHGDAEAVGTISSAAPSPRHGGWLGMAMVRVAALGRDGDWHVAGDAVTRLDDGGGGRRG